MDTAQTPHLLLLSLGPVQEFIKEARRTRDLWFGSFLLSELARAAAHTCAKAGCQLIFPACDADDPELEPTNGPIRSTAGEPALNIPNQIVAKVPKGTDPKALASRCEEAVHQRLEAKDAAAGKLESFSRSSWNRARGMIADDVTFEGLWTEQVRTLVEVNAVWAPLLPDTPYEMVRVHLTRVLSARKALRDFTPWIQFRPGAPKSSMDGARDSVLKEKENREATQAAEPGGHTAATNGPPTAEELGKRFRISLGEQLDAVGLIKRTGGRPDQFIPIGNIALAAWLENAHRVAREALEALSARASRRRLTKIWRVDLAWLQPFPYDAQLLLASRLPAIYEELEDELKENQWGERQLRPLLSKVAQKGGGEPHPYVACLVADGDKVSELLAVLPEAHQQRILSQILSEFATDVRDIVEKQHRGSLIYAGGDDVLAFVTLPDALGCANALRIAFEKRMTEALTALFPVPRAKGQTIPRPTLSVGIGIGHMLERMGDLIQLGRDAEQLAKDGAPEVWGGTERNALAIIQDKRSGGRLSWRTNWNEDTLETFNGRCRALVDDTLPTRKVYQIGALLKRAPTRERPDEAEARKAKGLEPQKSLAPHELEDWANHLRGEVSLNLARAQGNRGTSPEAVGLNLHPKVNLDEGDTSYEALRRSVHAWYCQTLMARTCVDAAPWSFRVQGDHDE